MDELMIDLPGETHAGLTRLEPIPAGDCIDNGQAGATRTTAPTTRQVASWTASPVAGRGEVCGRFWG